MPNFKKDESQLDSRLDKWLYFLKHLEDFQQIPQIFQDSVFTQAFEIAGFINMNYLELEKYEMSLKIYRDMNAVLDTKYETGKLEGIELGIEKGIEQGKIQTAKNLKNLGIDYETIQKATGLSLEIIQEI